MISLVWNIGLWRASPTRITQVDDRCFKNTLSFIHVKLTHCLRWTRPQSNLHQCWTSHMQGIICRQAEIIASLAAVLMEKKTLFGARMNRYVKSLRSAQRDLDNLKYSAGDCGLWGWRCVWGWNDYRGGWCLWWGWGWWWWGTGQLCR